MSVNIKNYTHTPAIEKYLIDILPLWLRCKVGAFIVHSDNNNRIPRQSLN